MLTLGIIVMAAAATGAQTTIAIPLWLTILTIVAVPLGTVLVGYMTYNAKVREIKTGKESEERARIDAKVTRLHGKMQGQLDFLTKQNEEQGKDVEELRLRNHRTEDYVERLRRHISDGNPPPPPPWPEFNGSHTSTGQAPKTD